jgi:putative transposase
VTDAALEDVRSWQSRPLADVYPVLYLDALAVKIRDGRAVRRKACYLVMGVNLDGERDVLGLWFQATEGAKFWMSVLNELKQRAGTDVLIACVERAQGLRRGDRGRLPQHLGADLHRPLCARSVGTECRGGDGGMR